MSRKTFMAAVLLSMILVFLTLGLETINPVKANPWFMYTYVTPIPGTIPPTITVYSPTNNTVYTSRDFTLNFTVSKPQTPTPMTVGITLVKYAIDGSYPTVIYDFFRLPVQSLTSPGVQEFNHSSNITLSAGTHNITIYTSAIVLPGHLTFFNINSTANIFFAANNNRSLTVVVNSPQNKTYASNDIGISISASDPTLDIGPESVAYSLDGKPQIIIGTVNVGMHSLTNSTTLSLPNGVHTIVGIGITWFNGADGVFYSSPVIFNVDSSPVPTPSPSLNPSPSPTQQPAIEPSQTPDRPQVKDFAPVIVPASIILLAIVVVGLLVYLRKRRG